MGNPSWHFVTQVCCEKNGDHVDVIFFLTLLNSSTSVCQILVFLGIHPLFSFPVLAQTSSEKQPDCGPWFTRPFWVWVSLCTPVSKLSLVSHAPAPRCVLFPPPEGPFLPATTIHHPPGRRPLILQESGQATPPLPRVFPEWPPELGAPPLTH